MTIPEHMLENNRGRMNKNILIYKLTETAKLPVKADGDMCYDVFADEDATIEHGSVTAIKTGIKMAPPEGYHYSVRDRSGLAAKHGLHVVAGQIDNSYRGELLICMTKLKMEFNDCQTILENLDSLCYAAGIARPVSYKIKKGDKIAQIKFEKDETFPVIEVETEEKLGSTKRGENGFGSSGL